MKFVLIVNQKRAIELGITNINQAHILDMLMSASTWAQATLIDNEVYYWVARQRICEELELIRIKPDTVYRHLKKLEELGLIDYRKQGKRDCIRVTGKGRTYYVGNESELGISPMSDSNPNAYIGNKSVPPENTMSDSNPDSAETRNEIRKKPDSNPEKVGNESDISNNHTNKQPEDHDAAASAVGDVSDETKSKFVPAPDWQPEIPQSTKQHWEETDKVPWAWILRQMKNYVRAIQDLEPQTEQVWIIRFVKSVNKKIAAGEHLGTKSPGKQDVSARAAVVGLSARPGESWQAFGERVTQAEARL